MRRALRDSLLPIVLLCIITLAALTAALGAGGYPVGASLQALVLGSVGSRDALLSATLVRTIPLIFTGLGVAIAFQGGVFNIGAEGQLAAGAAVATAIALSGSFASPVILLPVLISSAAVAGALWALIPAVLRRRFGVLEVISTIMMNFLAVHMISYLLRGPLQEPSHIYPQSSSLPDAARLPMLFTDSRLHLGLPLALLAALMTWVVSTRSAAGFRIRAAGANPDAARSAGLIDVQRSAYSVFLVSGALCGIAGGVEVTGVTYALYENISPGYGYTAIAVALLASLNPLWIIPSAMLFGALEAGAVAMQRDVGVPSGFVSFVEALIMLSLLGWQTTAFRRRSRASAAAADSATARSG